MTGPAVAGVAVRPHAPERAARAARSVPEGANVSLASGAVVQAALGIEFTLSGFNKLADSDYLPNFASFVRANPGANSGPLSGFVQTIVLPHAAVFAELLRAIEISLGPILLIGALEIARRRLAGRLGASHGYEVVLAFVAALAGVAAAGLGFSIFVLMGGVLPTVMPGRAFTSAIPVELLIVPLGLAVAWMEIGRFLALRHGSDRAPAVVDR